MKRVFHFLSRQPIAGVFAEYVMTIFWLLKIRIFSESKNPEVSYPWCIRNQAVPTKKISISCRNFLMPGFSGVNVWIENLCRALVDTHVITLYCQGSNLKRVKRTDVGNLTIVQLPVFTSIKLKTLPIYSAWNEALKRIITKDKITGIFIAPFSGVETFSLNHINNLKVYTLLVTDERSHRNTSLKRNELKEIERFDSRTKSIVIREAKVLGYSNFYFFADSKAILQDLQELFSVSIESQTTVLPINQEKDICNLDEKTKTILFIGRCEGRKGLKTLLQAWELIWFYIPDWKLVVATSHGDDAETMHYLERISASNMNCRMLINISDDEKHVQLAKSSIVVIPSLYESFGIVALESMQHGCATLASNVGGLPEVVGDSGILFEIGSVTDLSEKLFGLVSNPKSLIHYSEKSRARVKSNFSDENIREIFTKL